MRKHDILIEAINKNELRELLEGKNGYRYEDQLCSGPTNPLVVLKLIYDAYNEEHRKEIADIFIQTLCNMIDGNSEDIFNAIIYFMFQLDCEAENVAPFHIDKLFFEKKIKEKIQKSKNSLIKERMIEGINGSAWDVIIDMSKTLKEYGVNILN